MIDFEVVVAVDEAGGIGLRGAIPWRLRGDLAHFRSLTMTPMAGEVSRPNAVVMGRKTWDSLPMRVRPLPGRLNVVVSRNACLPLPADVVRAGGLEQALDDLGHRRARGELERCFVVGGAEVYRVALGLPGCRAVHLTRVVGTFGCDAFLAELGPDFTRVDRSAVHEEGERRYWFERWERAGR